VSFAAITLCVASERVFTVVVVVVVYIVIDSVRKLLETPSYPTVRSYLLTYLQSRSLTHSIVQDIV
jgi:hypothetical protein